VYPSTITDAQKKLIEKHLDLVLQANEKTNITRIDNRKQAELLHIEDSLVGLPECLAAPSGFYGDIGSGAGYPGFPIAIATGRKTTLVESVKKKAQLLDQFSKELSLNSQVAVYPGRTEELALAQPSFFSLITARAVTALPSLLELAAPLLSIGGWLVSYKADRIDDELSWALSIQEKLGFSLQSNERRKLSDGKTIRRILVFEKTAVPSVKLPRRPGMAQKRPYKA
jgi:16S rRNA (guanine527-N7)-methyltransferase